MFTTDDAAEALAGADIDISDERYGLDDVRDGMNVELEHGTRYPDLDVTGDDPVINGEDCPCSPERVSRLLPTA